MSGSIILPAKFDASLCALSEIKLNKATNSKSAYLNYNGGMSLMLQTPSLPSPFGLNVYDLTSPPKYSLDLAMNGYQENPKVKAFHKALTNLDDWMLEQGVKNSKVWFKEDLTKDDLRKYKYSPIVKIPKDKEGNPTNYPPNVKLNFKKKRDSDEFDCKFVDKSLKPLNDIPLAEMLPRRVEVTAIMNCTGVWFAGGKYGLSWKATHIRLETTPMNSGGISFVDEDSGETLPASSSNAASRPATIGGSSLREPTEFSNTPAKKAPVIEDSDEEDEGDSEVVATPVKTFASAVKAPEPSKPDVVDSDEEEAEHAPAQIPKKTVITKKKVIASNKK